ncbi:MAG: ABC transporter permease [Bacteroidota bacterium]
MSKQGHPYQPPPKWVDKLLEQFCAPELLEEVLGDLHERYYRRVKQEGTQKAQQKYWRDVLSYFRFSVFKRSSTYSTTLISSDMIRNYLKIAWRNLYYKKFFSLINIFGLALGIVCSILISLWIIDELSWDKFHTNIDRIYRVYMNRPGDDGTFTQTIVPLATWEPLKAESGIKRAIPTDDNEETLLLAHGDKIIERSFLQVGEDFLQTFNFKLLEGTLSQQLNDPSSIVLTESTAKALFGSESALDKTVRIDNQIDLTVSGVVEDPPRHSTLQFEGLISLKVIASLDPEFQETLSNWNGSSHFMFIELEEGVDPTQVEDEIRDWMKPHYEEAEFMLFSLERSRLYSEFENGKSVGGAIKYVRIFAIVAILILALACINFANLTTAQSEKRAREVGIRKTAGSRRWQLIIQFLSETMVIAFISFGVAILMVEILLPSYNSLVNKNLALDYGNSLFWGGAFVFILVTGIAAGSYPAFFLSTSQPLKVLRGRASKRGNLPLKVMVTVQFFFSIGLMICTGVIYSQIYYIKSQDIGYDKEHLLTVPTSGEIEENYDLIKRDLLEQSLASSVTVSSSPITGLRAWSKPDWQGKDDNRDGYFAILSVGYDYTQTLKSEVLLGREFDQNFSDSSSMLLNQAAVEYMGLEDPIGTSVELYGREHTIVGVLDDITMQSPYEPSFRTAFVFQPDWTSDMLIRLPEGTNISQTMQDIEEVFQNHNPAFPFSYSFVDEEFDRKFASEELIGKLANTFALLAIIISCLGLFGLSAFAAERRTKEIGIRKALGASVTHIVSLLSREFVKLVLIAMVFAAPLAWYLMKQWLQNFTYRVEVAWWMYALVGLLALLVAQLTVSFQSIKAALANPVDSLRNE